MESGHPVIRSSLTIRVSNKGEPHQSITLHGQSRFCPHRSCADREGWREHSEAIPARGATVPNPEFHSLIVNDSETERHLTWWGRAGAVGLLPEGEARQ